MPERAAELDQRLLWHPPAEQGDRSGSPAADLATALIELAPPGLSHVLFRESSASAVEAALELALEHWQQRGGQHRRRTSFLHLRGGRHADAADARAIDGRGRNVTGLHAGRSHAVVPGEIGELERVLDLHQEEIAGVIVEPLVEASAAVRVHPPGYLRRVRRLCDRHDAFLIADETETGFGRTGTMFACEQERVVPDLLCLGEALTGGEPALGAILTTDRVREGLRGAGEGRGAGTAGAGGASRSACAAALANLEELRDQRTLVRLQPKIRLLGELLDPIATMPEVAEVRGRGFVVGIDLGADDRALEAAHRVTRIAQARGANVSAIGGVVVVMPPPTIDKHDLRRQVEVVGESIRSALSEVAQDAGEFVEARQAA